MKPVKPQKKKITISAQKSKPKKADDFTVNYATGKRTLSGAEKSRRERANMRNLYVGKVPNPRDVNDSGEYTIRAVAGSKLPVSSGGKRSWSSYAWKQGPYLPAGKRTKKDRGR
jgi:hypothetical protein